MNSRSSTPAESTAPELIQVGVVRRAHGVRGEVLVEPLSDVPGRFAPASELLLVDGEGHRPVHVETCRPHGGGLILRLSGTTDRDAAAALRGTILAVERASSPPAPAGSYYHHELVGCACHDAALGELGVVAELVADGGGLLLRIETPERTLLVPFAVSYLKSVDVAAKRVELALPPGLVEACTSPS